MLKGMLGGLIFLLHVVFLQSCVTTTEKPSAAVDLTWPPAPAEARIRFVQTFSNPDELNIEKSLWQMVGEFFVGTENTYMTRPMSVVSVNEQMIYVADPGRHGVHRFDVNNDQYDLIRRPEDYILPSPVSLTVDDQGNVLVSDSQLAQIFIIRAGKTVATQLDLDVELQQPTGLVWDKKTGDLYVVDTALHQVLVFDVAGRLQNRFGRRGTGDGEFNFPTMIWQDDEGKLLVADSLNFRIQVFARNGRYLSQFGEQGDASGYQSRPKGVATDKKGHIYIVDALFHNVQIFNQKGEFLLSIGEQGQAAGQFWLPAGIFIDEYEKIYVADAHNRRVQVFEYIGSDE